MYNCILLIIFQEIMHVQLLLTLNANWISIVIQNTESISTSQTQQTVQVLSNTFSYILLRGCVWERERGGNV